MSDITPGAARALIIAKAAAITGIRSAAARLPETLTATPAFVLGPHTASYEPGQNRQPVSMTFPLRLYVERLADDDRTTAAAEAFIKPTLTAFSQGITLAGATTTQLTCRGWRADNWVNVGGTDYLMIEFALRLDTRWSDDYTA